MNKRQSGSWEVGSDWYRTIVGEKGHEYHREVILPRLQKLLLLEKVSEKKSVKLLDLACGNGILGRTLCQQVEYLGIDLSKTLVADAMKRDHNSNHSYLCDDVALCASKLPDSNFSHATVILALQNMERPDLCLQTAASALRPGGMLYLVINHPCFRIPRHSSWEVDIKADRQFRRIDSYSSSMKIPLALHPSRGESSQTLMSHHFSLATLFGWLAASGFVVTLLEEWCSHKKSEGGAARREDYARKQFPLFLALSACYQGSKKNSQSQRKEVSTQTT